jgi:hypothetical protein
MPGLLELLVALLEILEMLDFGGSELGLGRLGGAASGGFLDGGRGGLLGRLSHAGHLLTGSRGYDGREVL